MLRELAKSHTALGPTDMTEDSGFSFVTKLYAAGAAGARPKGV